MNDARRCPICAATLRPDARTARLAVWRCPACGHRSAEHASSAPDADYHLQYSQGEFLDALERTRRRQAQRIVTLIGKHLARPTALLDFGAGRGWLLDTARSAGFERLAGVDRSELSRRLLRERGFEALAVDADVSSRDTLPKASFRPEVLTLLDVLEHFPPQDAATTLRSLIGHFQPRLVVVKVPVSSGLLYRLARGLCAVGASGALEQLYQVGSHPPHYSYFSRSSLETLLATCQLELLDGIADLEFEPAELSRRARALRRFEPLAHGLGIAAACTAQALAMQDSWIAVARVSEAAAS